MIVTVETITPEKAAEWLALNDHNRSLKKPVVARLAGAISRGEWEMNGESIKLNGNRLLDGQHRLAAVIQADQPITSVVVRDVETTAQETIDLGTRRSLGDMLALRGEANPKELAAALVHLHSWQTLRRIGRNYQFHYPTPQQQFGLLDKNPALRASIAVGNTVKNRLKYPPSLATALHYIFSQVDVDDADDFWSKLTRGTGLAEGHPILLLRRYIQEETGHRGTRPNTEKLAAFTIKVWNAYRDGSEVKRLRYMPGGKSPEPFPVPA